MLSDKEIARLRSEYGRLEREMDKARDKDQVALANSYENSLARIAEQLKRHDIDPHDR